MKLNITDFSSSKLLKFVCALFDTGTSQTKKLQRRLLAVLYILRERHTDAVLVKPTLTAITLYALFFV